MVSSLKSREERARHVQHELDTFLKECQLAGYWVWRGKDEDFLQDGVVLEIHDGYNSIELFVGRDSGYKVEHWTCWSAVLTSAEAFVYLDEARDHISNLIRKESHGADQIHQV